MLWQYEFRETGDSFPGDKQILSAMIVREQGNELRFIFRGMGLRAKMLLVFQIGAMSFVSAMCVVLAFSVYRQEKYVSATVSAAIAAGPLYICWRLLVRITKREQLLVSSGALTLVRIVNGKKAVKAYPIDQVQNLCYLGNGFQAEHPLASQNLDPLGFGARQRIVNAVVAEGNMAFFHDGRMVRFGTCVSSWDAEVIDRHIREKTAGALSMAGLPEDIPEALWNK